MKKPPKIVHSINTDSAPKLNKPFTISKGLLKKPKDIKPPGSGGSSARGDDPDTGGEYHKDGPLFNTPIRKSKEGLNTLQTLEEAKGPSSYQKPRLVVKRHDRESSDSTGKASPMPDIKPPGIVKKQGPSLLVKGATPLANRVSPHFTEGPFSL